MFLFIGAIVAEGNSYLNKVGKAREVAVTQWLQDNPEGAAAVARYRSACIGKPAEPSTEGIDLSKPAITYAECFERVASPEFMAIVLAAENSIPPPILLSWMSRTLASLVLL
ncbi:hypothetical protein J5F29_19680 [Pseudomonas aeruginosa]|uniref:hypothetical protein n=1 Tax=Pseudomonas aeruginosa group TaxID=136841 RepID=UPI00053DF1EF|nr:hypothetical protein [Pseudomonas aeruginosa]EIU2680042.1 hypothetical protein [Pseudomonas aeruginosa]EKJ7646763.1 hypothetical protein [Pseudomonas aeruginosa]EKU4432823.1 hypothetical protein [Pseudomonas aeruginosa]EKU8044424.1 hypothetical protein [Pseudomonas aeruginosa]EKU8166192.1 hypothetical protein [Pseudomonas aeruginosa]